jgi:hypothetical protein
MIGAQIDGVMIFRYRGSSAMPDTDDKVIAAMKDVWLREIFPAGSTDSLDDGVGTLIAGLRDSKQAEVTGPDIRVAHHQPAAPVIAPARRKRRDTI